MLKMNVGVTMSAADEKQLTAGYGAEISSLRRFSMLRYERCEHCSKCLTHKVLKKKRSSLRTSPVVKDLRHDQVDQTEIGFELISVMPTCQEIHL
jgi:hypothetical protein